MTIAISGRLSVKGIKAQLQGRLNYLKNIHTGMVVEPREREVYSREEEASATEEKVRAFKNFTGEEQEIQQIENALAMIQKGTYGKCENCGQNIDPARLEAVPTTNLCLSCCSKKSKHR